MGIFDGLSEKQKEAVETIEWLGGIGVYGV